MRLRPASLCLAFGLAWLGCATQLRALAGAGLISLAADFVRAKASALERVDHGSFGDAAVPGDRARAKVALQQGVAGGELFWLAERGTVDRLQCPAGAQAFAGFVRDAAVTCGGPSRWCSRTASSREREALPRQEGVSPCGVRSLSCSCG